MTDQVAAGVPSEASAMPARSPVQRANAEQWDMTSKFTGRTYRIYMAAPNWAGDPPPGGFPVLYLNDGDFVFQTFADTLLMQGVGLEIGPAYLVGIGYGGDWATASRRRCADLLPSEPDPVTLASLEASPITKGATYGDAENFHRFMTEELRPLIDANYATDQNNNILWGASFGGLFALHVLFNHPEAYRTFLVGSPSINWSGGAILQDEGKLAAPVAAGEVAPRILFTLGEFEEKLADHVKMYPGVTREQMQESLTAFGMVTNALALADRLRALDAPVACDVETIVFENETHLSVFPGAISRGLRFALKPYGGGGRRASCRPHFASRPMVHNQQGDADDSRSEAGLHVIRPCPDHESSARSGRKRQGSYGEARTPICPGL
jgi:predicted alpha/beta superfamily hydrolase